jgi:hypothetical protein
MSPECTAIFATPPCTPAPISTCGGGVDTEFQLATAVWASAYLAIGARLEENRLLTPYGASYQNYRQRAPSLIPWRGRRY